MSKLFSLWKTLVHNAKWVGASIAVFVVAVLVVVLTRRTAVLKKTQADLLFYKAQLELHKLAVQNDVTMLELRQLRLSDQIVASQIADVEQRLQEKLKDTLTAEEIAERFSQLGVKG